PAPYHAAGLVLFASEGFELDLDIAVVDRSIAPDRPREGPYPGLSQDIWLARRGFVLLHFPARGAAAGNALLPARRQGARGIGIEVGRFSVDRAHRSSCNEH